MEQQMQNFIAILRSALDGAPPQLSSPDFERLFQLAQLHGVGNLLYPVLKRLPPEGQPHAAYLKRCKELAYAAASRDAIQSQELKTLMNTLQAAHIAVIPLKGCEIKQLYPQPALRYMSDTDLLIAPEDAEKIREILTGCGFTVRRCGVGTVDLYFSPSGMNYELHRSLKEEGYTAKTAEFLHKLRSCAIESQTTLRLSPEAHYVYILAHAVKHLLSGGTGARTVMDVWLCAHRWQLDRDELNRLLRSADLFDFSQTMERLAETWFGSAAPDALTEELSEYILSGAVFGTEARRVESRMLARGEKKGSAGYWLRRIFPSYRTMCIYFPFLTKCPIALPFLWVYRGVRSVFVQRKKLLQEFQVVSATNDETLKRRSDLFTRCGLKLNDGKDGNQ